MSEPRPKQESKGKAFERLVAAVQQAIGPDAQVEWDRKLMSDCGVRRQIDVIVRVGNASKTALIAVEAKHWQKSIDIDTVGAFYVTAATVGAQKGIVVSSHGFQRGALKQAKRLGIDTYVLREATDKDWEGHVRGLQVAVHSTPILCEDAEIRLANGERHKILSAASVKLLTQDGREFFFDRIVKKWLADNPQYEDQLVELNPDSPLFYSHGIELKPVAAIYCKPTRVGGMVSEGVLDRPEDWVFFKCLPDKTIEEKVFFEFRELQQGADGFKRPPKKSRISTRKRTDTP
ncbi:restriction endonuclease [Sorangium sp. So ce1014]|uniref:restriction endonuclease n=1 Tax=Sorangium sp. So ce1014 TaxID=3133326 RepID=UPI003F5D6A52